MAAIQRNGNRIFRTIRTSGFPAYPGIDLVYYGNQREIEYDFLVGPGADPSRIQIMYEGVEDIATDAKGDLVLRTASGVLRQRAPILYQEVQGVRRPVAGRYVLSGGRSVGFQVDAYDRNRPLVIDPVLNYATYLGGGSGEVATAVAVDSDGNAYVLGVTTSSDFPVSSGAFRPSRPGALDMFVTKINPAGTAALYSTYLGGSLDDISTGIAVDRSGSAHLTAVTISTNYPTTTGSYQPITTDACCTDIVVTKLNPAGSGLIYSTYLAGSDDDGSSEIALDLAGNANVLGSTRSPSFPRATGVQTVNRGGFDGFVARFNGAGTVLDRYTFFGGTGQEEPIAFKIDSAGSFYIVGITASIDFPVTTAIQLNNGGGQDAFVTKLTSTMAPVYSTYLGGGADDSAWGVAVNSSGSAYVAGRTASNNFRTTSNAIQQATKGGGDAFLTKFSADGTSLMFSTHLGGRGDDRAYGVALDSAENIYIVGRSDSADFPLTSNALQSTLGGGNDMFVTKLAPSGQSLVYSTFFGGTDLDEPFAMDLDSQARVYIVGQTASQSFPVTDGALQSRRGGPLDAIVVRMEIPSTAPVPTAPASIVTISGNNQSGAVGVTLPNPLVVEVRTSAGSPVADVPVAFTSTNATVNPVTARTDASGRVSVRVTLGTVIGGATITATVTGLPPVTFAATAVAPVIVPVITDVVDGGALFTNISEAGWVTIRGSNLAPVTRLWGASDFVGDRMPTSLDGVSVTINGKAAAIYYISPMQLNVLAPLLGSTGQQTVTVTTREGAASKNVTVQSVAPSFFMLDPENRRYVAAVNLDGTIVGKPGLYPAEPSATKPLVALGRVLIYGTGWGLTTPVQPEGVVFNDPRPVVDAASVRISIGGRQARVEFAGAVGPGLYQFNIVAPDLPAGDHTIVGEINGLQTQPNSFITVAAAGGTARTSVAASTAGRR